MTDADSSTYRAQSWQAVAAAGLPVNPDLILLPAASLTRTVDEAVRRLAVLHAVTAVAFGLPQARADAWLRAEGLHPSLTDEERELLSERPARVIAGPLLLNSVHSLAWALTLVPEYGPTTDPPRSLVHALPNLLESQSLPDWAAKPALRNQTELAAMRDALFCFNWSLQSLFLECDYSRSARLPLVREARRSLEWLFVSDRWDSVDLST